MIKFKHSGSLKKTESFFNRNTNRNYLRILEKYGREGVSALAAATPVDTGTTANSWGYEIVQDDAGVTIYWINSNIVNGTPIAIIIQYGHGTKNGGYVQGRDYINPALQPIFDRLANEAWMEVSGV